jgi:hypothetical protein
MPVFSGEPVLGHPVFTRQEIERFMKEADDGSHLMMKV